MDFLKKHSTTNNPALKIVAMALFIGLPILAFVLGTKYQVVLDSVPNEVVLPIAKHVTPSSKIYSNANYSYSVEYPGSWVVREFSGTKTGAAFQPANKAVAYENETITIDVQQRVVIDPAPATFEEYARVAAKHEIQGYNKLMSFEKILTKSGLIGYKTTWTRSAPPMAQVPTGMTSSNSASEPIIYFEIPNNPKVTLQLKVEGKENYEVFQKMIDSIRFSESKTENLLIQPK